MYRTTSGFASQGSQPLLYEPEPPAAPVPAAAAPDEEPIVPGTVVVAFADTGNAVDPNALDTAGTDELSEEEGGEDDEEPDYAYVEDEEDPNDEGDGEEGMTIDDQ